MTDEIQKLYYVIADAYEWLRDEKDEVYLSPSTVETLVHAALWRLEYIEAEKKKAQQNAASGE